MNVADAVVRIWADDKQLDKDLDQAETKTRGWAGRVGGIAKTAMKNVVVAAGVAATVAVASVTKAALDVSVDTERAAADAAAALGITKEAAEEYAEVARRVFGNNFADDVGDANQAIIDLAQQTGMAADDPSFQKLAENAFAIRDAFGTDTHDSISTMTTLMDDFGISGEQAMDMIVTGYQKGLDKNGDMLDSMGEYSNIYSDLGFGADEFFSSLETGLAGGVLGTDKIADATKEWGVLMNEGGSDAKDALDGMGLSYEDMAASVASGEADWATYFDSIVGGINGIEDPIARSQTQVALFGTMAEDLGVSFTEGLSTGSTAMVDMEGAIGSLDAKYETFGQAGAAVWRKIVVAVAPLTDKLLEMVNDAMPHVMTAFAWFETTGLPAIEAFGAVVGRVVGTIRGIFEGLGKTVKEEGSDRFAFFKDWIDTNLPLVQELVERIMTAMTGFWTEHGDTILRVVGNAFDALFIVIDTILKSTMDMVQFWLLIFTGDWEGAGETLLGIVERIWEAVKSIFQLQIDSIKAIFGDFDWAAAGRGIIEGIKSGIEGKWGELESWFRGKVGGLRDILPFSEPKDPRSPLRGLPKAGRALVEQIQSGIDSATLNLDGALGGLVGGMAPAAAGATTNITFSVHLEGGGYAQGRAAGRGIVDEMRARGLA